jgi:DeoR/GlpR family transcriptional regulator of sugar metabolism
MDTHDIPAKEERRNLIQDLIEKHGRVTVPELSQRFEISEATIRRDLESLAEIGKVQRVYGGAIAVQKAPPEPPILQRERVQTSEKLRIGRAAAALVKDGETVFLGSGTTVLEVARNLRGHTGLTVITNSLPVLHTLAGLPEITVVSVGGILRNTELSFIGHITEQALAEVRADKVIIGVHAFSLEEGLTNDYLPETMTDRAILRAGREVILVADHSKANTVAAAFLAPLTSVHTMVTDTLTPADLLAELHRLGIDTLSV